ncbi:hypothetical protein JCM6882_002963 [Rhodosporidiobolus microsporus]
MSCCCHTPSAAALGAGIVVLIITVPGAFYSATSVFFGYKNLEHPALRVLDVVALTLGVLAALAFLLAAICVIWSCTVVGQADSSTEGVVVGVGSILIFSIPIILTPLLWLAYELHAVGRQIIGRAPLFAPHGQRNPYVEAGLVPGAAPVAPTGGNNPYGGVAYGAPGSGEAGGPAGAPFGGVSLSLAHQAPSGRTRRGSLSKGSYAATRSSNRGLSESEGSLLSSDEEGYHQERQQRKQRSRSSLGGGY